MRYACSGALDQPPRTEFRQSHLLCNDKGGQRHTIISEPTTAAFFYFFFTTDPMHALNPCVIRNRYTLRRMPSTPT